MLTHAQMLVALADLAEVFRAADNDTAYATVEVNEHRETWAVRSKGFRRWLVRRFYAVEGKPPSAQSMSDALGAIEARAQFEAPMRSVSVRVAAVEERIYLDLADEAWRAVEIDASGWRVVAEAPAKFRRARGMLPLPPPVPGGTLTALTEFINVKDEEQRALLVAWLAAAARPSGPYPVLALLGEHGTAKSTTAEVLRALIDPNVAPLRAEPRDVRDIMIAANNGWMVVLDNLSSLEPWLSDCLCRLATGGGFSTRELYSNDDEVIFTAMRPAIINGIEAVIDRADLLDRAILVDLPRIDERRRQPRSSFWAAFEALRPRLLGALLDAVSAGLRNSATTTLDRLPRMADFAVCSVAAEPALGVAPGAFLRAYAGNRAAAHELALEASPVAASVRALVARDGEWRGTAGELLPDLTVLADEVTKRSRGWPDSPRRLGSALRRAAPNLREVGVEVEFEDVRDLGPRRRQIALKRIEGEDRSHRSERSCAAFSTSSSFQTSFPEAQTSFPNVPAAAPPAPSATPGTMSTLAGTVAGTMKTPVGNNGNDGNDENPLLYDDGQETAL